MPTTVYLKAYLDQSGTTTTVIPIQIPTPGTASSPSADVGTVVFPASYTPTVNLAGSFPLATGASTSALQATQQTALDAINNKVATAAKQDTMQASLTSIDSKFGPLTAIGSPSSTAPTVQVAGTVNIAGGGTLPTGASTSALQTAGNSSLTSLDSKVTACNTGNVTVASVTPPAALVGDRLSVNTTALQGNANTLTSGITLKADDGNSGVIYIGLASTVTTTNAFYRLNAGQALFLAVNNENKLWFIASAAAQTLYLLGS